MSPRAILFILLGLLLPTCTRADDTYMTIRLYPIRAHDYAESTVVNAVLRTAHSAVLLNADCFAGFYETDAPRSCSPEWTQYLKRCDNEIRAAIYEKFPYVRNGFTPAARIVRLSPEDVALLLTFRFGGTGGERYDRQMFLIQSARAGKADCPTYPFWSGVEVTPGNHVNETSCRNQPLDSCVRRLFWPRANALQLRFTSSGIRSGKLPRNAPDPTPND